MSRSRCKALSNREAIERLSGLKRKSASIMSTKDISNAIVAHKRSRVSHDAKDRAPITVTYTISEDRSGSLDDEKARLLSGLRKQPRLPPKKTKLLPPPAISDSNREETQHHQEKREISDSARGRIWTRLTHEFIEQQTCKGSNVPTKHIKSLRDLERALLFDVSAYRLPSYGNDALTDARKLPPSQQHLTAIEIFRLKAILVLRSRNTLLNLAADGQSFQPGTDPDPSSPKIIQSYLQAQAGETAWQSACLSQKFST